MSGKEIVDMSTMQSKCIEENIICEITNLSKTSVKNYDLNEQKALEKIAKNSSEPTMKYSEKSTCVNLDFNSGAYFLVILPFARKMKTDKIESSDMKMKCTSSEQRTDKK